MMIWLLTEALAFSIPTIATPPTAGAGPAVNIAEIGLVPLAHSALTELSLGWRIRDRTATKWEEGWHLSACC